MYHAIRSENRTDLTFCTWFTFYKSFFELRWVLTGVFFKNAGKMALIGKAGEVSYFG